MINSIGYQNSTTFSGSSSKRILKKSSNLVKNVNNHMVADLRKSHKFSRAEQTHTQKGFGTFLDKLD